jgi:hypothetical protein
LDCCKYAAFIEADHNPVRPSLHSDQQLEALYAIDLPEAMETLPEKRADEAFIQHIQCEITLLSDLYTANHTYHYSLRHFGDDAGEDKFYFVIPNATADQVVDIITKDNENHSPSYDKETLSTGTKLIFSNLAPVLPDQPKTLSFSYDAPSGAFLYRGYFIDVGFYRAELVHDFDATAATVTIKLPKGSYIAKYVGNATRRGAIISFTESNISRGERRAFPIFFYRRKKVRTVLAFIGGPILGAILDQFAAQALDPIFKWIARRF